MRKKYSEMTATEIGKILKQNFDKYEFCEACERNIKILKKWAKKRD